MKASVRSEGQEPPLQMSEFFRSLGAKFWKRFMDEFSESNKMCKEFRLLVDQNRGLRVSKFFLKFKANKL